MTATLPQDTWRTRHDAFKVVIVNMANEARIPIHCAVFGLFRDLIPAQLLEECCEPFCLLELKGELHYLGENYLIRGEKITILVYVGFL